MLEKTYAVHVNVRCDDWEIDLFAQTTQLVKTKVELMVAHRQGGIKTNSIQMPQFSPLELFEIGRPWHES